MSIETRNTLAIAADSAKLAHVFLIDGTPYDWGVSVTASQSPKQAYEYTAKKISYYRPDIAVTEFITDQSKKGQFTRSLINQVAKAAQDSDVKWSLVTRQHLFANKHEEATAIAKRFPELQPYLPPKRRWWQKEDQRMMIFEAAALGLENVTGRIER